MQSIKVKSVSIKTPAAKMRSMAVKAPVKPVKPMRAGANAQTDSYGKAMRSAFKNTKTFGMPGK